MARRAVSARAVAGGDGEPCTPILRKAAPMSTFVLLKTSDFKIKLFSSGAKLFNLKPFAVNSVFNL
jgi:hypothetical protein